LLGHCVMKEQSSTSLTRPMEGAATALIRCALGLLKRISGRDYLPELQLNQHSFGERFWRLGDGDISSSPQQVLAGNGTLGSWGLGCSNGATLGSVSDNGSLSLVIHAARGFRKRFTSQASPMRESAQIPYQFMSNSYQGSPWRADCGSAW
jgi:hypothetical protein